jgi:hypothetical protein
MVTSTGVYGIILEKIQGIRTYRRVGAFEIPTEESLKENEAKDLVKTWVSGLAAQHSEQPAYEVQPKWNMDALRLVSHVEGLKQLEIFIC